MTLGDIIKDYRMKNQMSMEYTAKLCGITKGYVAMLERNVNSKTGRPVKPTIETIVKVCNGLHLDVDSVFNQLDDDYTFTVTSTPSTLSSSEAHLIDMYRSLNVEGQEKVLSYASDLVDTGRYGDKGDPAKLVEGA